jgi:hypothetical protein
LEGTTEKHIHLLLLLAELGFAILVLVKSVQIILQLELVIHKLVRFAFRCFVVPTLEVLVLIQLLILRSFLGFSIFFHVEKLQQVLGGGHIIIDLDLFRELLLFGHGHLRELLLEHVL